MTVPTLQRGGDGHDRSLDRCRLGQRLVDVEIDGERCHQSARRSVLLSPLHSPEASTGEAASQRKVVDGVQLEDEAEVLVHEAQASGSAVRAVAQLRYVDWFTVEPRQCAGVRAVVPGQDLDQRGLARPVVADEGMDLTGAHVEVDVVERFGPREGLGHPRHPQQRSLPVFDDVRPALRGGATRWSQRSHSGRTFTLALSHCSDSHVDQRLCVCSTFPPDG